MGVTTRVAGVATRVADVCCCSRSGLPRVNATHGNLALPGDHYEPKGVFPNILRN
ncbi:hypothetical protein GCM10010145_42290 [Streptomyces ruber]|uniref:Uncharacterized protein n=2 Tax=Streptomyces TaxID=1883 RepID=A0A918ETZ4_9ACTN|nr:hypothetical protein GCM10010145_42290 [Streptomyces ruber]